MMVRSSMILNVIYRFSKVNYTFFYKKHSSGPGCKSFLIFGDILVLKVS